MNEDDNRKITRSDLSYEFPTDRAVFRYQLVKLEEDVLPAGSVLDVDADFEPPAESSPESSRDEALMTLSLGLTVGLIAGVAWGIGLPPVTALIAGLVGAIVLYLVVHVTFGRPGE